MNSQTFDNLKRLKLSYLVENFESFIEGCYKSKLTASNIIERLCELEVLEKDRRGTERRLRQARLGKFKRIDDFDWAFPQNINRDSIENLLKTDFINRQENIILAGAQGLGKTMIAKNIAYHAVMKGKTALFTTASQMVMMLKSCDNQVDLNRMLKKYVQPDLLIIDELGYLSYDHQAADLIFEIINQRYEVGSIMMTTNLAFKDWNTIFPGAACLTAMIDRLTHHLQMIKIDGGSYRLKESKINKI
jgi:DNA replication protein DnaC